MRILLITEFFGSLQQPVFSGGVETRTFYTAKHLASSHQVVVLCRRRTGEKAQEKQGNLFIKRFGHPVDSSVATVPSLWSRALFIGQCLVESRDIKADVVEGSNFVTLLPAFLIGIGKREPKVAWYPDVLLGDWRRYFGPVLGVIGSFVEKILLTLPWDKIIAISEPVAGKLKKRGIEETKINIISCGIELDQYKRRFKKYSRPTVCVISRLLAYKRVEDVVQAISLLQKVIPHLRLIIVGEGPEEKKLKQQVETLSLSRRVIFKKRISQRELIDLIGRSHLLVHPSLIEGFGIVLVEAAAAGTPYVATRIPALKALNSQLRSGILIPTRSPQKIAQAIKRMLEDKQLYKKKQERGKRQSRAFSWKQLTLETERVYHRVVPKKRIAFLIDVWFPFQGGGQIHVRETTKILRQQYGYKVKIFGGFSPALWARILWDVLVIPQVVWEHLKSPFSLIHAHAYSAGIPGKILSWLLRIPVVYTVHGSHTLDILSSYSLRRLFPGKGIELKGVFERWLTTGICYDAEITVAQNFLQYPNKNKNVLVIPNGADPIRIKNKGVSAQGTISFLFVGRLDKIKGVDVLLKTLAKAKPELPAFKLAVVGQGPERKSLERLAQKLGLRNEVDFLGLVKGKELTRQYRQSDVFILPSLAEGQPIVVLEAWAAGLPVVATRVGHNNFMINEGENGFLVAPGSVVSLQKGIRKAIRQREKWRQIGKNGYSLVRKRYTWRETTSKIVTAYKKVLKGGDHATG